MLEGLYFMHETSRGDSYLYISFPIGSGNYAFKCKLKDRRSKGLDIFRYAYISLKRDLFIVE